MFISKSMTTMSVLLLIFVLVLINKSSEVPVIGILTQETYIVNHPQPTETSFIAASYVKFVEAGGAKVIPIWIGQDLDYYRRVVNYTNGVLFPGGGTYFNETGGYGEAAKHIYDLAVKANENRIYFPLYGICLGMQVLAFAAMDGTDIRVSCSASKIALPLNFTKGSSSRIFASAPKHILHNLKTENLTYNHHRYCLFESDLRQHDLLKSWDIISRNKDRKGVEFVSVMENKNYPFYGLQFHPEKNIFEFKENAQIPHGKDAVEVSQYFANFFVEECRKNKNTFPSKNLQDKALIYNYLPKFTGLTTSYEQIYYFNQKDYNNNLLLN